MSKECQELRRVTRDTPVGTKVQWGDDSNGGELLGFDNAARPVFRARLSGEIVTAAISLYVSPLCWVEDRPVYKGDTLYHRYGDEFTKLVVDRLGSYSTPSVLQKGSSIGWHIECLTWKAPKVKREGWIAVKTGEKPESYASWCSHVCKTKEQAEAYYGNQPVCCVRIEWEEEA